MGNCGGDDDIFETLFSSFFNSGFNDQFKEMTRQMDEMFHNMGDIHISAGFHPPQHAGRTRMQESPRDQMLKDPENTDNSVTTVQTGEVTPAGPRHGFWGTVHFPSVLDKSSPFSSPFENRKRDDISTNCGCEDTLSWQPEESQSSWSTSWNKSFSSLQSDGSGWSGQEVQTVRHSDGSVETIEKKTENGRTCTTVTKTDPHGVSTTTTTCDRPAIEGTPATGPVTSIKPSVPHDSALHRPSTATPPTQGLSNDDQSFFKKLFGFDLFKPKS